MDATGRFCAVYCGVSGGGLWYFRIISFSWFCISAFLLFTSSTDGSSYGLPVKAHMVCAGLKEGSELGGGESTGMGAWEDSGSGGGVKREGFGDGDEEVKSIQVPPRWERVTETCWKQQGQERVARQVL